MAEESTIHGDNRSLQRDVPLLREYQKEMYERSLKGNTIVSMDTGSGKTMVAIYRIMDLVECGNPNKIIWFLAPTVELCHQQSKVIKRYIPLATTKLLIGEDGIEHWRSKAIWDEALDGVHVIVSTYAILYDAVAHSFVELTRLAMLIIDEAHHCTKKHPLNEFMRLSYSHHLEKYGTKDLPSILGLTASPAKTWRDNVIPTLEKNLHSICITPRLHRQALLEYVHRPNLIRIEYPPLPSDTNLNGMMKRLELEDKHDVKAIISRAMNSHSNLADLIGNSAALEKTLIEQRKKIRGNVDHILEHLGAGPAAEYLESTIRIQRSKAEEGIALSACQPQNLLSIPILEGLRDELSRTLASTYYPRFSAKVEILVDHLCELHDSKLSALVFVKRRVVTTLLAIILETHQRTKHFCKVGSVVGLANSLKHSRDISESIINHARSSTLDEFRIGLKNIVIATDALEEGIDIAECNLVVCFDPPENLKSFIQRRGRARQAKSTYTVLVPKGSLKYSAKKWEELEQKMNEAIQNTQEEAERQLLIERTKETVKGEFRVEKTGAFMTADQAKAHLHHFCNKLPKIPYTASRPCFSFKEDGEDFVRATVTLPVSVPAPARHASSCDTWKTEDAAMKDAALQSVKLLHSYELLTDNLLPLEVQPVMPETFEKLKGAYRELAAQYSPWLQGGQETNTTTLFRTAISFFGGSQDKKAHNIAIWTRFDICNLPEMTLHLESGTLLARFGRSIEHDDVDEAILKITTEMLINASRSTVDANPAQDFVAYLTPDLLLNQLSGWIKAYYGTSAATKEDFHAVKDRTLIENPSRGGPLYIFQKRALLENGEGLEPAIECVQFPKRRKFLQSKDLAENMRKKKKESAVTDSKSISFAPEQCYFRRLPIAYAWTSRLVPSIFYHLEMVLTATQLQKDLVTSINLGSIENLMAAITSPITGMIPNYETLEFLGDTVLKFLTSHHVYNLFPNWHEGSLTNKRHSIISNVPLAKAGIDVGLDRFILRNIFKAKHWRVPSFSALLCDATTRRHVSLKNIADVVEALIGASYVTGGLYNAALCISKLGVVTDDLCLETSVKAPLLTLNTPSRNSTTLSCMEDLINHRFKHKFLALEALTHPSYTRDAESESYQRLEFLGDAVLDMIISTELYEHKKNASQGVLTKIKSALVNADFLAFLCLDLRDTVANSNIVVSETEQICKTIETKSRSLWMCMRTDATQGIPAVRSDTAERFDASQEKIKGSIGAKKVYPWTLLAALGAPKFFSDIIESTLGAVFVDSGGSWETCRKVAERLGLFEYLQTFCKPGFDVTHPKERLHNMAKSKLTYRKDMDQPGLKLFGMRILAGEVEIGRASGCKSRQEAVLKASEAAIDLLESGYTVA